MIRLNEKLNLFQPDIIHIHNFYHFLSPSIFIAINNYKKKNAVKIVFTAHDYYLICPNSALLHYKNKKILKFPQKKLSIIDFIDKRLDYRGFTYSSLKKIQWFISIIVLKVHLSFDVIISPSVFLQEYLKMCFKVDNTLLIRNFSDNQFTLSHDEEKSSKNRCIKVCFFGRVSQEKGLFQFIEIFKELPSDLIQLQIIGDGNEKNNLISYCKQNNLTNIQFINNLNSEELKKHLLQNDAMILPSLWYENAPLSIVEAAQLGLFVITTNYGGTKEISEIVGNNFFISEWNPKELLNIINQISNQDFISNQDKISTVFGIDNFIDQHI